LSAPAPVPATNQGSMSRSKGDSHQIWARCELQGRCRWRTTSAMPATWRWIASGSSGSGSTRAGRFPRASTTRRAAPSRRGAGAARADPTADARAGRPRERDHAGRPRARARLSRRPRRVTIGCSTAGAGGRCMTRQNQPDLGGKTGDGRPHSGPHGSCATVPRPGYPREVRGGADHWKAQGSHGWPAGCLGRFCSARRMR